MREYQEIKGIRHYVYENKLEWLENVGDGLLVGNWREAKEGEWTIGDDGGVVQILRRGTMKSLATPKNSTRDWVRTIVGTFYVGDDIEMDTDFGLHKNRYTFSRTIDKTAEQVYLRDKCNGREIDFALKVAVGINATQAYMQSFSQKNPRSAKISATILLRQERIQEVIRESLKEVLDKHGINDDYIITGFKRMHEEGADEKVSFSALKELGKMSETVVTGSGNQLKSSSVVGLFKGFDNPEALGEGEIGEID